ncbi:MAG: RNA polymerase sigma-54 factor, partial [Desulfobacteraceae bacterium]|nr:RNA polymerase sigma-54 factor [Desulfobacteraceae bacterium]
MEFGLQQNLTLTQQLVMTPQLQQAIKLLQLSRLELVDMIQEEMEQNPALEEAEQQLDSNAEANASDKEASETKNEDTKEVTIEEKVSTDTDWENYINEYNSTGKVHVERETRESTNYEAFTTREKTLEEHLRWQLMLYGFSKVEEEIGYMIIGNIDIDGYLRSTSEEIAITGNFDIEKVEKVINVIQGFDPSGVCARDIKECLLAQIK